MADSPTWLGGNVITWGDGRPQATTAWGDRIVVADPPSALTDLGVSFRLSPMRLWKQQPSLRKVVEFTAEKIAGVPLHVYRRVSETDRQRDREAENLLNNPSPFVTGPRFISALVTDWMLYDRWMAVLMDDRLIRIPAGLINVKSDFLGGLTALRVQTESGLVDVTDTVCAYDAGWAGNEEGGRSPLQTLGVTLEEQARSTIWRSRQWRNASKISGTLNIPADTRLPDKKLERMRESWQKYERDAMGGTPVLEGGTTFTPFDMRPVATNDLEGRKLADAEVASYYHIPPELVGAREGTFSNVTAFRQMLYGPTLGPKIARIEAALNARIIPQIAGPDAYAEFNREGAMSGSFEEQASIYSKAAGGPYMTRNEVRARQNMPRIDGADELIVPKNVAEGGLSDPTDTAPDGDPYGEDSNNN